MPSDVPLLLEVLRARLDSVTDRVVACLRGEIPVYATVPDPDLRPGVRSNVERALDALERGWEPTAEEIDAARALGEHRAQQGLPLDALLQAHRIGVREALAVVRDEASQRAMAAEAVLDIATRAWAWADAVMLAAAGGHRERELGLVGQEQQQRAHLLRGLLHGGLEESGLQVGASAYGLGLHQEYLPLYALGGTEAMRSFERDLEAARQEAGATALIGHLDDGLAAIVGSVDGHAELRSVIDAAAVEASDLTVAVGPPALPSDLEGAYRLAQQTLEAARVLGRTGVVAIDDVTLHAGVLAQPDIGELLDRRYLAPLDAAADFGAELIDSLTAWYEHGMRTDETAAALFIHPNTLRHRLKRAEQLTGVSLQATTDRFALWWALIWRRSR